MALFVFQEMVGFIWQIYSIKNNIKAAYPWELVKNNLIFFGQ
jgi:hypothetical protein